MRAKLIEVTRYSPPPPDASMYDGIIQRAGSQGGKDYQYDAYHPGVMKFSVRGAYWYFGSSVGWKTQADLFLSIVGSDFQFLACDFEETGNVLNQSFVAAAMEFMAYVAQKTGKKVILYTNQSIYQDFIAKYDGVRAAKFPLWFAWPASNFDTIDTLTPPLPAARKDWTFWQYLFGEHAVDKFEHDVFNGDAATLRAWAEVETSPQPQPATDIVDYITIHYKSGSEKNVQV